MRNIFSFLNDKLETHYLTGKKVGNLQQNRNHKIKVEKNITNSHHKTESNGSFYFWIFFSKENIILNKKAILFF